MCETTNRNINQIQNLNWIVEFPIFLTTLPGAELILVLYYSSSRSAEAADLCSTRRRVQMYNGP